MQNIKLTMKNYWNGTLESENASVEIGSRKDQFRPYELLYGAMGSCIHATFMGIADKMRTTYDDVTYEISGQKRSEIPTMLTDVWLKVTFKNGNDEEKLTKAMKLATEYCSIFNTIQSVATMHLDINFQ